MSEQLLTLVCPGSAAAERYALTLESALKGLRVEVLPRLDPDKPLQNRRILFAVPLDETGVNPELCALLALLRAHTGCLEGSVAGVMADGAGDLYTKAAGRELVLSASRAGCLFPGRPLVEAVGSLRNFTVQAKNAGCSPEEAYSQAVRDLVERILEFEPPRQKRPKITVLHASNYRTSNTLALWSRVRDALAPFCDITEIALRNGTMEDCSGCPYTMCLHFGEKGGCFYGGLMQQEVYPAVRRCQGVVMLCPNYNDALSANLTAFVNRLTALFRQTRFYDKALFAIVVSGYSGGDILARQLIAAMNMNKSFFLPGKFVMLERANDPGEALAAPGVGERLDRFVGDIKRTLLK